MAQKIAKKACFNGYEFINDMIQDGYLRCIEKIDKFGLERTNPFAYYTTVIHNRFIDYIKSEKKQFNIKVSIQAKVEEELELFNTLTLKNKHKK
jgi:RNA polymerase sigma factor (sigma-70 family)